MRQSWVLSGMLGLALGDALGAPVEFGERWMRDMDPVTEMREGGLFDVPAGGFTDDTSMALATLDSLRGGFSCRAMMERYLAWLRTGAYSLFDHPIGVGRQVLRALEHYEAHGDLRTCAPREEMDNGNGALMRILPVCLYACGRMEDGAALTKAVSLVEAATAITHAHPRSLAASALYFFAVRGILYTQGDLRARLQAGLDEGFAFLAKTPLGEQLPHYARIKDLAALSAVPREVLSSTGYVVHTLEAALWALATQPDFKAQLLAAVNLGLDTDTVAAVAGGLAGLYTGYDNLPADWLKKLQKRDMIESICRQAAPDSGPMPL